MIKALLIDLDGVIRLWHTDNDARAEQVTGLPAGAILEAAFADDLLPLVITGYITDEVWRTHVGTNLARSFPKAKVTQAIELWSESPGELDADVLALVRACRHTVRVVLVTNATSRLPKDLERLGLLGEFDHIINSSEVGHVKPQKAIYEVALYTARVAAAEALFVDDSAKNVRAAQELGIAGHVFDGAKGLKHVLTRAELLPHKS